MAELKTKPTDASVGEFLSSVADENRRADCLVLLTMMQSASGAAPRMWGTSMVGFGQYHYRYASGREGDWFLVGFSPRKNDLTLYIMAGFEQYDALLSRLGKFKLGKSCLYIKWLADVDWGVLQELITASVQHMRATNP